MDAKAEYNKQLHEMSLKLVKPVLKDWLARKALLHQEGAHEIVAATINDLAAKIVDNNRVKASTEYTSTGC